ncbi:MAG: hypothetical protein AB1679_10740 [Actinomycetota bacterium]|jgi:uncharacterized small protein (DUF1192 family)
MTDHMHPDASPDSEVHAAAVAELEAQIAALRADNARLRERVRLLEDASERFITHMSSVIDTLRSNIPTPPPEVPT